MLVGKKQGELSDRITALGGSIATKTKNLLFVITTDNSKPKKLEEAEEASIPIVKTEILDHLERDPTPDLNSLISTYTRDPKAPVDQPLPEIEIKVFCCSSVFTHLFKDFLVETADQVWIKSFPSNNPQKISISAGTYATLCKENTALVDGRLVVRRPGQGKSLLFVIQMRHTESDDATISLAEITYFWTHVQHHIVPKYTNFDVIPVLISNKTFSQGTMSVRRYLFSSIDESMSHFMSKHDCDL